jgi:ATP-binding cassette subfamily C protein
LLLQDAQGKELLTILDYSKMVGDSRGFLEKALRANSFISRVDSVERLVVKGDELEWHVLIGDKKMMIQTRGRRNVILFDGRVVLIDPNENVAEINLDKIDRRSRNLVNRTV